MALIFIILAGLGLKMIDRQRRALDIDLKGFLDGYRHTTLLTQRETGAYPAAEKVVVRERQPAPTAAPVSAKKESPARAAKKAHEDTGPLIINPNTADESALLRLPGIGPVLAQRIIAYRDSGNYFSCAQDLLCVRGIGRGKLEQIERYLEF